MSPRSATEPAPAVWITRAEPGASETAARAAALGFLPRVLPLTSANGVRAFARLCPRRPGPIYVVGAATAAAARAAGFPDVIEGAGDVEALAARILADPPAGEVLHASAREPAGDLVGRLAAAGRPARSVALYAARDTRPAAPDLEAALASPFILVHSPRAGRRLAGLLAGATARPFVLGLSRACLAPLEGLDLAGLAAPDSPLETDLLNLLASRR